MSGRILVIRGGAIGDFVLTLPAIGLLREAFPQAHIELLGYRHIVELAVGRYYVDASCSIEYGPLAGFFNPKSDLDPKLSAYFASFDQVISYLFDPDEFFAGSLRRAGVRNLIHGTPKIGDHIHAAAQLAEPLQKLALFLDEPAAHLFPSPQDLEEAGHFLSAHDRGLPVAAIHPGSGGERKNWPISRWCELTAHLLARGRHVLVVGGESDLARLAALRAAFPSSAPLTFVEHLPLPLVAAILFRIPLFVGHDSGISHIAAAAGLPCVLLFGPTDPAVWAPANEDCHIVASPTGAMDDIALDSVRTMVDSLLGNA